jgi:thioredoxin reductase (NADPH)
VAVIGGGDSAVDEALVVADHAEHTLVLVRGAAIHAAATTTARLLSHPAITVELGVELEEILGGDTVSGLRIRGRDGQGSTDLAVDGVFIYAGLDPNTELVCDLLDLDDEGRVPTDAWMETSIPGLFAAGDLRRDSPGQLVNVASDGATAAIAAHQRVASNALGG